MTDGRPDSDSVWSENEAIWKSDQAVQAWLATMDDRERARSGQWHLIGQLLPFSYDDRFTFVDLGAGTGPAARAVLRLYPHSEAILADFSPQMIGEAAPVMAPFEGRYRYVELDLAADVWPGAIPTGLGASISSQCVHHLPDDRKQALFARVFDHLVPGGWYLNFDPVSAGDPIVDDAWSRANSRLDPETTETASHRTPDQQARHENHVRHIAPLGLQVDFLRRAGFEAVDVYWKHLDYVIFGGRKPLA